MTCYMTCGFQMKFISVMSGGDVKNIVKSGQLLAFSEE